LAWAIRRPSATVGMGIGIFIVSIFMASQVPFIVIPRIDAGQVRVVVEVPPGTTLLEADRMLQTMVTRLRSIPEIEGFNTQVNSADGAATEASINVQLKPREDRDKTAYEVQNDIRPILLEFPNYRTSFQNFQGPDSGADIMVQFVGQNPAAVNAAA